MSKRKATPTQTADPVVIIALRPGPYRRIIGDVEWSQEAGWQQAVTPQLAADLLSQTGRPWAIARINQAGLEGVAHELGVPPQNIRIADHLLTDDLTPDPADQTAAPDQPAQAEGEHDD